MWDRCTNPKSISFPYYGALGVSVGRRWRDFGNFLSDMGECPPTLELERKDPFGNYNVDNCTWATTAQQARNKRDTTWLTLDGVSLPLVTWSERVGIPAPTLHKRLRLGWNAEDILTKPINTGKQAAVMKRLWRSPLGKDNK